MGNGLHDPRLFEQTLLWRKLGFPADSAQPCLAGHQIRDIPHPHCIHRATCAVQGMESVVFSGRIRVQLCHTTLTSGCCQRQKLSHAPISGPVVEQAHPSLLGQGICQALFAPGTSCPAFFSCSDLINMKYIRTDMYSLRSYFPNCVKLL